MTARHGLVERLTAYFGLALLALNLLAGALLTPKPLDLSQPSDWLEICSYANPVGLNDDGNGADTSPQAKPNCLFCLPLLHAGPAPDNQSFVTLVQPTVEVLYLPVLALPPAQALPPGSATPRAPPAYV